MPDILQPDAEILSLRYQPHPGQVAVHGSPARFRYDCVIALALANAMRRDYAPPPLMPIPIPHPRATARAATRALP